MRKIQLTHLGDQRKGETFEFSGEVLRIGRGEWNDLVFSEARHTMVSRSHAEITQRDNTYVITDHNSSTGTYLNGEKISHAIIKNGDILRFGLAGPEVSINIPSSDMRATVVVPSLQPSAPPQEATEKRPPLEATERRAPVEATERRTPSDQPLRMPAPPAAPTPKPPAPPRMAPPPAPSKEEGLTGRREEKSSFREKLWPIAGGSTSEPDLAALQLQIRRLTLIAGAGGALLLVLAIFAIARVSGIASGIENHAARLDKLDTATGELLQRLSSMDTQGIQQMFEKKSKEMDQRARQMEKRAQDMEQKFQVMFDRKSREVDQQFELLGQAYPQVKAKMDDLRRRRRN